MLNLLSDYFQIEMSLGTVEATATAFATPYGLFVRC